MRNLGTVIAFTYRNRLRSRPFIVTLVILAILITVGINLPYLISKMSSNTAVKIGMIETGNLPKIMQSYYREQPSFGIQIVLYHDLGSVRADEKKLNALVQQGTLQGYLELQSISSQSFPNVIYKSNQSLVHGSEFASTLQGSLQAVKTGLIVKKLGLTSAQLQDLNTPVNVTPIKISALSNGSSGSANQTQSQLVMMTVLEYVFLFLLFFAITMSGTLIASEITSEKSSRVMEILITSVSPLEQMFGKIIGMGLIGLTQVFIVIVIGVLNLSLPENHQFLLSQFHISLQDLPLSLILYLLFFYLTGYFLYATLFATVGSMVSRVEDLGQVQMPITFLLMIGFYVGIFGLQAPSSTLQTVMSFIPFFSPFIMFLRIGLTNPPAWQIAISIALLLATIVFIGWLSAQIYRTGVLMYGKRPSIKELRRAMRSMKAR